MELSPEQREGLNVALNEATLLGLEVDPSRRLAGATFSVLALQETGVVPSDSRVQMLFVNVGRVAVSLFDESSPAPVPVPIDRLLETVQSFNGGDVYGWEFVDVKDNPFQASGSGKSLDLEFTDGSMAHSINLFQGVKRKLDLCVWFEDLKVRTPDGIEIDMRDFIAAGRRWWDAFHKHDPRTQGRGMFSMAPKSDGHA